MRKIFFIAISMVLLLAQESLKNRLGSYDMFEHPKGEVRSGYIYTSYEAPSTALAAHFHFLTRKIFNMQAKMVLYGVEDFDLPSKNSEFYGEKRSGFFFISEASLKRYFEDGYVQVGRFSFNSPHADEDDVRMVPNFFQGLHGVYEGFQFAYLDRMAGWDSGGKIERFKPLYEVYGLKKSKGMVVLGKQGYNSEVWLSWMEKNFADFYGAYDFYYGAYHIGLQLDGRKNFAKEDSLIAGAIMEFRKYGILVSVAYNKKLLDGSSVSFGGGPYYTSLEDQSIDLMPKDAQAFSGYLCKNFKGIKSGAAYGNFWGYRYDKREIDLFMSGHFRNHFYFDVVYANIDDRYGEDYEIFRMIARYSF